MNTEYPYVGFHFLVEVEGIGDEVDKRFQEVSGLNVSVNTEDYAEGGENHFVHKLPKGTSYDNLVLKRGVFKKSGKIANWCNRTIESLKIEPKNILVSLLNEDHQILISWNVIHAYPVKWSFSGLNAESNDLLIENIEFTYKYFNVRYH